MTRMLPLIGSPEELRGRINGEVLIPGDPTFEAVSQPWNRTYTHHPSLVVIPSSPADVSAAIRHAADSGLAVAVQSTGHGVARPADGAMLISARGLKSVLIDGDAWTACIGGGSTWADVLGPATEKGLAPLLGSSASVGVVGHSLCGGIGWLARKYGLSVDRVRSIEVVTADGAIRRASPDVDADLFWALRGAGAGSLGVVTRIEIDLVPVDSLYAGSLFYAGYMAREVAARYRDWVSGAPEELTTSVCFVNFPDFEGVPDAVRGGSFVVLRGALIGSDGEGSEMLRFWRDWRPPQIDTWDRIPFSAVATISNDPPDPIAGMSTTEWFDTLSDQVVEVLIAAVLDEEGPGTLALAEIRHLGGAVARQPEHPNAYTQRQHLHLLQVAGLAPDPESAQALSNGLQSLRTELAPHTAGGAYLNFVDGSEKVRRSQEAFDTETWSRLRGIKEAYDPHNLFSHGVDLTAGGSSQEVRT